MKKAWNAYLQRILIGLMTVALILGGCQKTETVATQPQQASPVTAKVTLAITQHFGQSVLHTSTPQISKSESVMALLEKEAAVDLAYDGGFVQSIKGISSQKSTATSKARDWFYYVNGVLSDVGAADYTLKEGDAIWWDYHEWGGYSFTPAVIGQYPEPFKQGFRENGGALILFAPTEGGKEAAKQIETALANKGVQEIVLEAYSDEAFSKRDKPCLVVGEWTALASFEALKGMNENASKTGANVTFKSNGVDLMNPFGDVKESRAAQTGVIVATGAGMGDKVPAWFVIGTDTIGLNAAAHLFTENPDALNHKIGLAVTGEKVTALPIGK